MVWPRNAGWWAAVAVSLVLSGVAVVFERAVFADITVIFAAVISFILVWRAKVVEKPRLNRAREKRKRRQLLALCAVGWIPCALLFHYLLGVWPFSPRPIESGATATTPTRRVFVDCQRVLLPVTVSPGVVYGLDGLPARMGGLAEQHIVSTTKWPSQTAQGWAYRCEIKNSGTERLFKLQVPFVLMFREWVRVDKKTRQAGAVLITRERYADISDLQAHDGRFVLYVWNPSEFFLVITVPESARAENHAVQVTSSLAELSLEPAR